MDWKVFWVTFGAIFLAEMGDKTQLAALTMAAETRLPLSVFLGAAAALVRRGVRSSMSTRPWFWLPFWG